jgi:hypothetical protein
MPKLQQLTADPDVAPPWVLPRQASDELHRLGMQSGPARPGRRYIHLRRTSSRCHPTSLRGLPGCGFSGSTRDTGRDSTHIAKAWDALIQRLGYEQHGASSDANHTGETPGMPCLVSRADRHAPGDVGERENSVSHSGGHLSSGTPASSKLDTQRAVRSSPGEIAPPGPGVRILSSINRSTY